ncbi:MerR family transcriptional regulator [Nocardioides panacisoli]|uniref:MerR family transcriptional regulator n=1 Tax=Nocardioides panacisoli TaxID=627624 RepID=UPI001C635965|nr:MerR family transcriptional regulator [Nocardioides panacisoli]QYJ03425.1 MerR family transcriptional regulator [Nocardioides panacisoli]
MKSTQETRWRIGELAERFDLPTHVLRHWEEEGLLRPERDAADRRLYRESDAYRVAVILANKSAGMSLEQVRALLDATATDRRAILEQHLADLEDRIVAIRRSQHMTEHALECRAHDIAACPNFASNVADIVAGTRTWREHARAHEDHDPRAER